ncbi:MAG: hypothetical protein WCK63_01850, partial [Betaproteobacteria bacterium]
INFGAPSAIHKTFPWNQAIGDLEYGVHIKLLLEKTRCAASRLTDQRNIAWRFRVGRYTE